MGKIGVVGQLGLALIMPYALPALGGLATGMMGTQLGGALGAVVKGAGHFLNAAVKVGTRVGTAFKSVTSAVTDTIGNMVGATINSLPGGQQFGTFMKDLTAGKIDITELNFDKAWANTQNAWSTAGSDLGQLFSKSTFDSSMNKFGIQANLEKTVGGEFDTSNISYDPVTNKTSIGVDRATGTLGNQGVGLDVADSLGLGTPGTTYSASGLPLGTDEALFTVGGTAPSSSLLAPETMNFADVGLDAGDLSMSNTRPMAADPFKSTAMDVSSYTPDASKVPTEFDAFTNVTDTSATGQVAKMIGSSKSLGTKAKDALAGKGIELTTAGGLSLAQEYVDAKSLAQQQEDYRNSLIDPFANIDMSYLTPAPVQSSPGLSTSNMMASMGNYSDFYQIQQDILNSNYNNIYAQGYYGSAGLQAGLAQAYEELAA